MDLRELQNQKDFNDHWYYVSKARAIRVLLNRIEFRSILDVGAGSGILSKLLLETTAATEACCVDTGYIEESEEFFLGKRILRTKAIDRSDAELVLLLDVLEHVRDDISFVREYAGKVSPGTQFVISAPAYQSLFSTHDVFLGHYRRYTASSLEACIRAGGLTILRTRFFFLFILPTVACMRLISRLRMKATKSEAVSSDLKSHGKLTNRALIQAHRLESAFFRFNRFAGLSVLCLATKK